jgi:predicted nucleic-acid-binding protein
MPPSASARAGEPMIGIDTNVLIRYVVQDDARQAATASHFIETTLSADEPGWIASIVLCEFVWVLESAYGYARNPIVSTLQRLFEVDRFRVEAPALAWRALDEYRAGADFSDALIALGNEHEDCAYTATFDRGAARLKQMRLLSRASAP